MTIEYYAVGGAVRDQLLGLRPHDFDFTVVGAAFDELRDSILAMGGSVFLEKPEYGTIRASVPVHFAARFFRLDFLSLSQQSVAADFVISRKDGHYSDGRRPDSTEPGTLYDDLARRDFTVNALAKAEDGELIDFFHGQDDIADGCLRAVGGAVDRFQEDALRAVRAIRFAVTKGFVFNGDVHAALSHAGVLHKLESVSIERVRAELHAAFVHDTIKTLDLLAGYPDLRRICLGRECWLKPTLEKP